MKYVSLVAAALTMALTGGVAAHDINGSAQAHAHPQNRAHAHSGPTTTAQIRIDCYRGPWKETIWDHPRGVFIDDLMLIGYDYANASAIAYRVCRDVRTTGNPPAMQAALLNAIAQTPPGHKPKYSH